MKKELIIKLWLVLVSSCLVAQGQYHLEASTELSNETLSSIEKQSSLLTANFQTDDSLNFTCGDNITFTYRGQYVTYGSIERGGLCWLDRNLGASRVPLSMDDPEGYGDLFQWGRLDDGHQYRYSSEVEGPLNTNIPGHSYFITVSTEPYDWRSPQNNDLWQDEDGINNPCPSGWRLPTEAELQVELQSWNSYNSMGAFASPLKWPNGGARVYNGRINMDDGTSPFGQVWSTTQVGTYVMYMSYSSTYAGLYGSFRGNGLSLRCVKDHFEAPGSFNLNLESNPLEGGVIEGNGQYQPGQQINISATAKLGWEFAGWTGDIDYINNPSLANALVTMPEQNITLTANFQQKDGPVPTQTNIIRGGPSETGPLAIPIQISGVNAQPYTTDLNQWIGGWQAPQSIYDQGTYVNNPDLWSNIGGDLNSGTTWTNSNPGSGYGIMVVDLQQVRQISNISVFQMFSDGKTTHIALAGHPEIGSAAPYALDNEWSEFLTKSPLGAGTNFGTYVGDPTRYSVNTSTRYIKIMAYNDGTLGHPSYIELKGIKMYGEMIVTDLPVVSTSLVSGIAGSSASTGGNITNDGGTPVTSRGVVWNKTGNPTLESSIGRTIDGTGTGLFVSTLTHLSPTTHYYVRAYASNEAGTSYGETIEFTTKSVQFAGGIGTESDPWLIETPDHLNNVRHFIGINNADKHFKQIADIDLAVTPWNEGEGWIPIGGSDGWFWGHYDGDGHVISNLYINRSTNAYQGLIERSVGTIANLGVVDATVIDHGSRAGILIGVMQVWNDHRGQIINCYTSGTIESDHPDGRIGGVVGWNSGGDIIDSWSSADVTAAGTIAGGLAGGAHGGTFTDVHASGNVTGASRTGGLVGNIQANSIISGSYASGNVTCSDSPAGGLVGNSLSGSIIINSYATGRVVSIPDRTIGGLVGVAYQTTISNTYATGKVETQGSSGGLVAFADSLTVVQNSFWDLQGTDQEFSEGGQGLSTSAMLQQDSFSNWNFVQVWSINEGETYPWLQWQQKAGAHNYVDTETISITANASPPNGGHIQGTGVYPIGGSVTLTAQPTDLYDFSHWTENETKLEGIPATYVFVAQSDRHLVAHFELKAFSILASASPSAGGKVNGVSQYGGQYLSGEQVTLEAVANQGYEFMGWIESTELIHAAAAYTFIATGNRSLVALFDNESISVFAGTNQPDGGSVFGGGIYNPGDPVTLIAEPAPGYHFLNWLEDGVIIEGAGAIYGFIAETTRNLVANFATQSYTIVSLPNPGYGGDLSGAGNYAHGDWVTMQATPSEGYRFASWKAGNTIVSTNAQYSFEANANKHLVANFVLNTYTVNLQSDPHDNLGGSVAGGGTFVHGTEISVVASPNMGFAFDAWTEEGNMVDEDVVHNFVVNKNRSLIGNFLGNSYDITANGDPMGTGQVTGQGQYYQGEVVSLNAQSDKGYYFLRWMEDTSQVSVNSNYMFSATKDRAITAEFAIDWIDNNPDKSDNFLITATVSPAETGVVIGQGNYDPGQTVTLEASPNVGIEFIGWYDEDGEIILGNNNEPAGKTLVFTASSNMALTALFGGDQNTVTVTANPESSGQVSITKDGGFFAGEFAMVKAKANSGYVFNKWTLGIDGSQVSVNPEYGFTVTEDIQLIAWFTALEDHVLSLAANHPDYGSITGAGSYSHGSQVSIEAMGNPGYSFLYWSLGDELFSTEAKETITLNSDLHLEAFFSIISYDISADRTPISGGVVTGSGSYTHGHQVEMNALASNGWHFVKWTENDHDVVDGDGSLVGSVYTFNSTVNRHLTAHFDINTYNIQVQITPGSGGQIEGSGQYQHLEMVALVAVANQGYSFIHWQENGTILADIGDTLRFLARGNRSIDALFEPDEVYSINFEVHDKNGTEITDAIVTFDGNTYDAGVYSIGVFAPGIYDYKVTRDGYKPAEGQKDLTANTLISIALESDGTWTDKYTSNKIVVYPNPASSQLNLESGIAINRILITDMSGRIVYNTEINEFTAVVSTRKFEPGIYFIHLDTNLGVYYEKVVIHK